MIYTATLSRENFVAWLGGNPDSLTSRAEIGFVVPRTLKKDQVALIWDEQNSSEAQPIVVVPVGGEREFFAFVTTYIATYSPFSAFFHVIALDKLNEIKPIQFGAGFVEGRPRSAPKGLVGIALAEAYLHSDAPSGGVASLSVQACLASMSSAMLAGLAQGYSTERLHEISRSWLRARTLLSKETLRIDIESLKLFWSVVFEIFRKRESPYGDKENINALVDFVSEYIATGTMHPVLWQRATRAIPTIRDAIKSLEGNKEQKVRVFDKFVGELFVADRGPTYIKEFSAGAMMAMVSDGSFEYLSLFEAVKADFPNAALWFGLFTSLDERTDVFYAGSGLGRRVAREIFNFPSLLTAPTFDISLEELELLKGESPQINFRTQMLNVISVELSSGVVGRFRITREPRVDFETRRDAERLLKERLTGSLREGKFFVDQLNRLFSRIEHDFLQPDLFEERRVNYRSSAKATRRKD